VGVGSRKGLRRVGRGWETCGRGCIHDGESGREVREGVVADRRGPQASEGERANGRSTLIGRSHRATRENGCVRRLIDADRLDPLGSGRERGRDSVRAWTQAVADRWGLPVKRRRRPRLGWAELGRVGCFWFSFSLEF
jgi:hypothetical protein